MPGPPKVRQLPIAPTVWDIRRSALAKFKQLASRPNVSHLTIGYKVTGGVRSQEKSLRFYVHRKEPRWGGQAVPLALDVLAKNNGIIGNVRTDVEEIGDLAAFGVRSGHVIRAFDNDLGVCALTYAHGGARFLLTNAHVVVNVANGGKSGPISILNRVDGQYYSAGTVQYASRLVPGEVTTSDIAVVRMHDGLAIDQFMILDIANDIDRIDGISTLAEYQYWYVVNGHRFHCSGPERVVGTAPIMVDGVAVPYAEFWQLTMSVGGAARGHSGALLCRTSGNEIVACGIVFGGIAPSHIFAFPFNKMWRLATGS